MHPLERFADPRTAFLVFACWVCVFVAVLARLGAFSERFLHFGPSSDPRLQADFLGSKVDTWPKACTLYALGFATVCFSSYYKNVVGNWLQNSVRDHKQPFLHEPRRWAYAMATLDPVLGWVNGSLGLFVMMTLQLQFVVPQMLGEVLVTLIAATSFLSQKRAFGVEGRLLPL